MALWYNSYIPSEDIGKTNLSYSANEQKFAEFLISFTKLVVTAEVAITRQATEDQIPPIQQEAGNAVDRAPPLHLSIEQLFATFDGTFGSFQGGYLRGTLTELQHEISTALSEYFSITNEIAELLTGRNIIGLVEYTNLSLVNAVYRPTGVIYGFPTVAAAYELQVSSDSNYSASLGNDLIYFGFDPAVTVDTGRGNDLVFFSFGDNSVRDGAGNDAYIFASGNNELSYSSSSSSIRIDILWDGSLSIENSAIGETDYVKGVDRIVFSDKVIMYDEATQVLIGYGPSDAADGTVYRFYNKQAGGHFFTTDPAERDIVAFDTAAYRFEGTGFGAELTKTLQSEEVYRFFNMHAGGHFFTTSESERDQILNTMPNFRYEGIGFYAYDELVTGSTEVYRFFNQEAGGHFFTTDTAERDAVIVGLPQYVYEGVGFYAYPA